VAQDRYVVGAPAAERLDERGIPDWQVVAGLLDGSLLRERPDAHPNPAIEVDEALPDGTTVKAVWSWLPRHQVAKLVTVHYYDG
jgi:hypothetical protein